MKAATDFEGGTFSGASVSSKDPSEIWFGQFQFAVVATSWDVRSTGFTKCDNLSFENCCIVNPTARDTAGLRDSHDPRILEFCRRVSSNISFISTISTSLRDPWKALKSSFWAAMQNQVLETRNSRIFIDISTCPRYLSLALIREALNSGLVSEIVVAYCEGIYPPTPSSYGGMEEISFKKGALQAIPVPGYLGDYEPSREKLFVVSVGFDGWKTLNQLCRKEPEHVAVLLGDPGVIPEYAQRTRKANSALFERFGVVEDNVIRADAGDAVAAWKALTAWSADGGDDFNVSYLCSGNKPHSLALALRAMSLANVTLMYNRAARSEPIVVDFSGNFWRYSIKPNFGILATL